MLNLLFLTAAISPAQKTFFILEKNPGFCFNFYYYYYIYLHHRRVWVYMCAATGDHTGAITPMRKSEDNLVELNSSFFFYLADLGVRTRVVGLGSEQLHLLNHLADL